MRTITPAEILGWQTKFEWPRATVINGEIQHYIESDKNAFISPEGDAVLRAVKEDTTLNGLTQPYSSAVRISKNDNGSEGVLVRTGQTVEILARLPDAVGAFAAFWLLRDDPVWQKTEVDIFETTAKTQGGMVHQAFHSHVDADKTYQKFAGSFDAYVDVVNTFNRYGARIMEDKVEYLFNGEVTKTVELHDHEKGLDYYMLLNLAIAPKGHWAGGTEDSDYDWDSTFLTVRNITIHNNGEFLSPEVMAADAGKDVNPAAVLTESGADANKLVKQLDDENTALTVEIDRLRGESVNLLDELEAKDKRINQLQAEIKALIMGKLERQPKRKSNPLARLFYAIARAAGGKE